LSTYGYIVDYRSLLQTTSKLFEQKDIAQLKSELDKWSNSLEVDLPTLNESNLKDDLNISLILLLDQMIIETLKSTTSFSQIDPIVFLERENDSIAFYHVALHSKDSLFLPEILLEFPSGNLPVLVDDKTGLAEFSIRKKNKNEKHQFKGSASYISGQHKIKIGEFDYPRQFMEQQD
jgi:hypothetical protein